MKLDLGLFCFRLRINLAISWNYWQYLPIHQPDDKSACLPANLPNCQPAYQHTCKSADLLTQLYAKLLTCLSTSKPANLFKGCLPNLLSSYLATWLPICPSTCWPTNLPNYMPVWLPVFQLSCFPALLSFLRNWHLPVCLLAYQPASLPTCLPAYQPAYQPNLSVYNLNLLELTSSGSCPVGGWVAGWLG